MILSTDALIITLLVGAGIPLVTDLITRRGVPGPLKSLVSLLLATAAGILTPLETQAHVGWKAIVASIITGFVTAAATHYNAWLPFGITGDTGVIQATVPAGIGAPAVPPSTMPVAPPPAG